MYLLFLCFGQKHLGLGFLVGLLVGLQNKICCEPASLFVCVRGSCPPLAWFYLSNTEAYSCLQVWVLNGMRPHLEKTQRKSQVCLCSALLNSKIIALKLLFYSQDCNATGFNEQMSKAQPQQTRLYPSLLQLSQQQVSRAYYCNCRSPALTTWVFYTEQVSLK